jgi:hypothetical protein
VAAVSDIVDRLRVAAAFMVQGKAVFAQDACTAAADEIERLRAEAASLRLTLGGRTFDASVPEPVGCPCPGACSTVAEIERLRGLVAAQEATR